MILRLAAGRAPRAPAGLLRSGRRRRRRCVRMRSATRPTSAPPIRATTTFSRPLAFGRSAKPSRPRSDSSGSSVSRNDVTPSTSSSLAGSAARLAGASRISCTDVRDRARYSWPATSKVTSLRRSSFAPGRVVLRGAGDRPARRWRARSCAREGARRAAPRCRGSWRRPPVLVERQRRRVSFSPRLGRELGLPRLDPVARRR